MVLATGVGPRVPIGGNTRQGVVHTDLQSPVDCEYILLPLLCDVVRCRLFGVLLQCLAPVSAACSSCPLPSCNDVADQRDRTEIRIGYDWYKRVVGLLDRPQNHTV